MFKCQKCKKLSKPGEKQNKVTIESRPKVYKEDEKVVGKGFETVNEINVCNNCKGENKE